MALARGSEPRARAKIARARVAVLSCLSIIAIGSLPAAVAMVHCHSLAETEDRAASAHAYAWCMHARLSSLRAAICARNC